MLVKITLLYILLGTIMIAVLWYIVQLFLLLFRGRKKAVYLWSFDRDLSLMAWSLPLVSWKKIIDLGCGDGKALRFFVREYDLQCQWYDINRFAILYGKFINRIKGYKMKLFLKDFKHAPIGNVDYVYLYLFPEQLVLIEDWLFLNIKGGTIIISNTFQFKKHKPFQVIEDKKWRERIFLYRK